MKIIFIVIDGLADGPIPELENKTPLEAAQTPNLDYLAKIGICGLIDAFKFDWQEDPKSDVCHLALFGYEPQKYYLGRGAYEAAGNGFELKSGDVAFRANFGTVNEDLKVMDRRAGRIEATQPLVDSLAGIEIDGVKFLLSKAYGHRAVLVMRDSNLSAEVSDSDPKNEGEELKRVVAKNNKPEALFTARILNEYLLRVYRSLKNHPLNTERIKEGLPPANCLLTRGAGQLKETPSFKEKYGLSACCVAGGDLYKGVGKLLGMDLLEVEGATGLRNTNLRGKISAAKEALEKCDFVFLHIKAPDSLAEDGNHQGKKEFIEAIDENLAQLLDLKDVLIVVTGDHATCSALKRHCQEPLPVLIAGSGMEADIVEKFSERACQKGSLGRFAQLDLMTKVLSFAKM